MSVETLLTHEVPGAGAPIPLEDFFHPTPEGHEVVIGYMGDMEPVVRKTDTTQYPFTLELNSGTSLLMSKEAVDEYLRLGLEPDMYVRHGEMLAEIGVLRRILPDYELSGGVAAALRSGVDDIAKAGKFAREEPDFPVTLEEVARTQRDLAFMLLATSVALGAREIQEGIELGTHVWPESSRRLHKGSYESVFRVSSESWADEGDFDGVVGEDRDFVAENGFHYSGELRLTIDPSKRIEFTYTPDQPSARHYHESTTVVDKNGRQVQYRDEALSLRIDLDSHAPAGVALDIGRSRFEGERLRRPGDLAGNVLASVASTGSHRYEEFTPDMRDQFEPFAQELIVQQVLNKKFAEDQARRVPIRDEVLDAMSERYRRNNLE